MRKRRWFRFVKVEMISIEQSIIKLARNLIYSNGNISWSLNYTFSAGSNRLWAKKFQNISNIFSEIDGQI